MTRSLSHALHVGARTTVPPPKNPPARVAEKSRLRTPPVPKKPAAAGREPGLGNHCEITGQNSSATYRAERFGVQRTACKALAWQRTPKGKSYRVLNCQRAVVDGNTAVQILQGPTAAKFGGLQTCGSVWTCAVCAEKISRYREGELAQAMRMHLCGGGFCLMVTFTHSHARGDSLAHMVSGYRAAMSSMTSWRAFKDLLLSIGFVGKVVALETTYGHDSGWHPHGHELWYIEKQLEEAELEELRLAIYRLWQKACIKHGLPAPNEKHGIAISYAESAAQYMAKANTAAKWTAAKEMTRGHSKQARGQRFAPFDLLRAMADGYQPEHMMTLFREYAYAYHGRNQLRWSRGLKARFDLVETEDEEVAAAVEAEHTVAGQIDLVDWRNRVMTQPTDRRAELLEAFEQGGMEAVTNLLGTMPIRCRYGPSWGPEKPPH
jgi:hypothetical protein